MKEGTASHTVGLLEKQIEEERRLAIIDAYRPACLCNKIRRGVVAKAIHTGAKTFAMVRRRTGVGTGPCGAKRCGPMVRGMLGEEVETCTECSWSILKGDSPPICPRCGTSQRTT